MFTLYLILFRSLTLICFSLLGISSNKTSGIAPYIFRLDALRISSLIFFSPCAMTLEKLRKSPKGLYYILKHFDVWRKDDFYKKS